MPRSIIPRNPSPPTNSVSLDNPPLPQRTVTYDANGGDAASLPFPNPDTRNDDIPISTTIPTRPGFTFSHWSEYSTGSNIIGTLGIAYGHDVLQSSVYTESSDVTLYAIWDCNACDCNCAADSRDCVCDCGCSVCCLSTDTEITEPPLTATPPLATEPPSVTTYSPGRPTPAPPTPRQYRIVYDANGGVRESLPNPNFEDKLHDIDIPINSTIPNRPNFAFRYWSEFRTGRDANGELHSRIYGRVGGGQSFYTTMLMLFYTQYGTAPLVIATAMLGRVVAVAIAAVMFVVQFHK